MNRFGSDIMFIDKYNGYLSFLDLCSKKLYDDSLILHNHHIVPSFIEVNNDPSNLIKLSVDDHIYAHYLLSLCYESGSYENLGNLYSCRFLKKSIKKSEEMIRVSDISYRGENNPFYNKKHTEDTVNRISEKIRNNDLNKSKYEIRYIDPDNERDKRKSGVKKYWENTTLDERKRRGFSISESLKGKNKGSNNPMSFPIIVDGKRYRCIGEALEELNISRYLLFKNYEIIKLERINNIKRHD